MQFTRDITQGRQSQGADEQIVYSLTTTNWGSSPTNVTVKAYDLTDSNTDVTSTVLSGSASVSGDVITLPTLKSLTAGRIYQVEVLFTAGGSIFELPFVVVCAGFTYIGDLSTDLDKVRFHLRDVDAGNGPLPGDKNFQDSELNGLLSLEGNWQQAVAAGYEVLAAGWAHYADLTVGPRRESLSQIAEGYAKLGAHWREQYGFTTRTGVAAAGIIKKDGYSDDVASDDVSATSEFAKVTIRHWDYPL
jgi:hypothetical protein